VPSGKTPIFPPVSLKEAACLAYQLDITSLQAVKQVTEAALSGSAIAWIVARFDISAMEPNSLPSMPLVLVHMERGIRRPWKHRPATTGN